MWSRRYLAFLGITLLLGAGLAAYLWQRQVAAQQLAQAAIIRQETVKRGTILSTVSATGFLAPRSQVSLYFSVATALPVAEVNVTLGQAVRKGDVLARLDSRELELELDRAQLSLKTARLALDLLEAPPRPEDLALAEASLRLANAQVYAASLGNSPEAVEIARLNLLLAQTQLNQTYNTMDALVAQGSLGWQAKNIFLQPQADQQVQEAKIADERYHAAQRPPDPAGAVSALAAVEQAQVALDRLKAGPRPEDLEIARLRVDQSLTALELAQHNLGNARLEAPFDGTVAAVNVRPGELAVSALPAIVLADTGSYYLDVAVDEVDVAGVAAGQVATVTLDALTDTPLSGRVENIALTSRTTGGVVSYAVRLVLASAPASVRAGMTATAEIIVGEARDVLLVPNWAIRRDRELGQAYAGVLRNGQIEEVTVTLGLSNEAYSQVIAGLAEGDAVAVDTARERLQLLGGQ
jgi:HlyD family secretion protein